MSLLIPYAQLSREQREMIDYCVNSTENIFIEGPPWSGKSLIALYSLRNIVKKNNSNSLFMVSNNAMHGYMSMALKELGMHERVNIDRKNKLFWKMASDNRISVSIESGYKENYDYILTCLLEEEVEKKYSIIVVSEVQDYLPKEWELMKQISHRIVCYGDFRQAVYINKVDRETIIKDCIHKQLNHVSQSISTDKLIGVRDYLFGEGESVESEYESTPTLSEDERVYTLGINYKAVDVDYENEFKAVAEKIEALEGENNRVAIICPNNNRFDEFSSYLENRNIEHNNYEINSDLKNHDFTQKKPLLLSVFNAEGLHFDDVILFGFDESNYIVERKRKEDRLKNVLYVAMTRARYITYIIRTETTVKELREIV